jgi:hypothetical protein
MTCVPDSTPLSSKPLDSMMVSSAPHHAAWIAHEPAQLGNRSGVGDLDRGRCALLPVDGIETVGSLRPPDALTSQPRSTDWEIHARLSRVDFSHIAGARSMVADKDWRGRADSVANSRPVSGYIWQPLKRAEKPLSIQLFAYHIG